MTMNKSTEFLSSIMQPYLLWSLTVFTLVLSKNSAINYYNIKLAANDYLLVFQTTAKYSLKDSIRYQCSPYGNKIFKIDFDFQSVDSVSLGREQTHSQLYFVLSGIINESSPYMSKITVNCSNDSSTVFMKETVFFKKYPMSNMIVSVDPHGRFAVGLTNASLLYYDLISLKYFSFNITWPDSKIFLPLAVDISNHFIYIAGYSTSKILDEERVNVYAKTKIYVLSIENNYTIKFYDPWVANELIINPIMKVSLRVNSNNEQVLLGILSINTVHLFITNKTSNGRLIPVSSKMILKILLSKGYGWGVEWLNDGRKAIILNIECCDKNFPATNSYFEYYDMNDNNCLNNSAVPFSIFPIKEQNCREFSEKKFLFLTSTTSALYVMTEEEDILIIPSSKSGFFSVRYLSIQNLEHEYHLFFLVPNSVQCRPGTYKNDSGPWACRQCQVKTTSRPALHGLNNNVSVTCPQCTDQSFCPLEFDTSTELLFNVEQYTGYPETPEIDVFEDILLRHMFRTECLRTSPLLFIMIVLLMVLISSIVIGLMKFSKRLVPKQQTFIEVLRHLDFIEHGQLWFGGLISIAFLVLLGFAVKFSYFYHYQYPIESEHLILNQDSCQLSHHLNAKFETNLQFLKTPFGEFEQIFHLLNSQEFILNIELINTKFHCGHLQLAYQRSPSSPSFSCYTQGFTLYASATLSSHSSSVLIRLPGSETVEAIRIGLTGPNIHQMNNYVQKLNLSKVFNYSNRMLTRDDRLFIGLQITKIINITEGLTDADLTMYSGLWLPIFHFDLDELFEEISTSYFSRTELFLQLSETPFFIKNKQKPIARSSEIIFSTILFICMCLDFVCMMFILMNLWFKPIIKFIVGKLFSSSSWIYRFDEKNKKCTLKDIDEMMKKMNSLKNEIQQHLDTLTEKMNALLREHTIEE